MAGWNPQRGSIYRTLLAQSSQAIGVYDFAADGLFACTSGLGCDECRCHWRSGDYHVTIITPQFRGRRRFDASDLVRWLPGWVDWDRTTGALKISRVVSRSARHLAWVNPSSIAAAFRLAVSEREVEIASSSVQALGHEDEWLTPQLRHDGIYDFVRGLEPNLRPARRISLFRTAKAQIFVGQTLSELGISGFECPPGRRERRSVPDGKRFECLAYEFKLAGQHSFEFTLA